MPIAMYTPQIGNVQVPSAPQQSITTMAAPYEADAKVGQAVNDVGLKIGEMALQFRDKNDAIELERRLNQHEAAIQPVIVSALSKQGSNAIGATDAAQSAMSDVTKSGMEDITNPRIKALFLNKANAATESSLGYVRRHEGYETIQAAHDNVTNSIDLATQKVNIAPPEQKIRTIQDSAASIISGALTQGIPEEKLVAKDPETGKTMYGPMLLGAMQKMYTAAIQSTINSPDINKQIREDAVSKGVFNDDQMKKYVKEIQAQQLQDAKGSLSDYVASRGATWDAWVADNQDSISELKPTQVQSLEGFFNQQQKIKINQSRSDMEWNSHVIHNNLVNKFYDGKPLTAQDLKSVDQMNAGDRENWEHIQNLGSDGVPFGASTDPVRYQEAYSLANSGADVTELNPYIPYLNKSDYNRVRNLAVTKQGKGSAQGIAKLGIVGQWRPQLEAAVQDNLPSKYLGLFGSDDEFGTNFLNQYDAVIENMEPAKIPGYTKELISHISKGGIEEEKKVVDQQAALLSRHIQTPTADKPTGAAPQKQTFNSLPPAANYKGKTGTDTATGQKYISDGVKWNRVH